ncbi:hypothetical protein FRB94_002993 [Tulasnella sp. JGI-2019a]|nr:hypothetical protein FRB94_002993 [Tulasnella sp. JGI-2019a]
MPTAKQNYKVASATKGVDYAQFASWSSAKATEVIAIPCLDYEIPPQPQPKYPASAITVPDDILYKIFLVGFSNHPRTFGRLVSHVCRRWRRVALDSPILWSQLVFDRDGSDTFEHERLCLGRSYGAPLDVEISGKAFAESKDVHTRMRKVMQLIEPHAGRWKSLKLSNIPENAFIVLGDRLAHLAVPNLETLTVSHRSWKPRNANWKFRPFLSTGAPRLKNLTLRSVPFEWDSSLLHNLHKLTLDVLGLTWSDRVFVATKVYTLLSQSPELMELVVSSMGGFMGSPARGGLHATEAAWPIPVPLAGVPSICRPKLTKLFIESAQVIDTILQSVQMPALKALPVKYRMSPSMAPFLTQYNGLSGLTELNIDSGCVLKPEGTPVHKQHIAMLSDLLLALPSVEQLGFQNIQFGAGVEDEKWFGSLAERCPKLKRLTLQSCGGLTERGICDVVSRRKAAQDMESLEVLWVMQCQNLTSMTEECAAWLTTNVDRFAWSGR